MPPSLSRLHLFGPWLQTPQGRSLGSAPFPSWVPGSDLLPPMGESLLLLEVGWTTVGPHPGDPIHRCVALLPTSLLTAGPESLNQIHGPDCCLSQARALPCCMAATYLTPQAAQSTSSWDCYTRDSAMFSPNTQPRELQLCVLTLLCSLVSLSF